MTDERIREIAAEHTDKEFGGDCCWEVVDVVAFARAVLAEDAKEKADASV